MTLQTASRWLSKKLLSAAMQVSPSEHAEWARAMSREVDEIPGDREALMWAFGCLQTSCHARLKSIRPTNFGPVRWGMALWVALLAVDTLFYAGFTLAYKLGVFTGHYPDPRNIPRLEVTPLWDPVLALLSGVVFLWAMVLILRRSRLALQAVVAPFAVSLFLFASRLVRPESGDLESLSIAYQKSHYALMWPIAGLTFTILMCVALWRDRQTPAAR
jgi:hypothetical protein